MFMGHPGGHTGCGLRRMEISAPAIFCVLVCLPGSLFSIIRLHMSASLRVSLGLRLCLSVSLCLTHSHLNLTVHPTPFCPSPCISSAPLRVLTRAPPSPDGYGPQWATYLCGRTIRSESGLCPLAGWHGRHPLPPWRPGVLIAPVCTPG